MLNTISDITVIQPYPYYPDCQLGNNGGVSQLTNLQDLQVRLDLVLQSVDPNDPVQMAYLENLMHAYEAAYAKASPLERLQAQIEALLQTLDPNAANQIAQLQGLVDQLNECDPEQRLSPQNQLIYDQLNPADPQSILNFLSWILTIEPENVDVADQQNRVIAELNRMLDYGIFDDPIATLQMQYIAFQFFLEYQNSGGSSQVSDAIATINANYTKVCDRGWLPL